MVLKDGTSFLLDTNMVSYVARKRSAAAIRTLNKVNTYCSVAVSAVTEGEIRFGFALRPEATRSRDLMERFLAQLLIVAWDSSAAQTYGLLCAELTRKGQTISALDLMIAAHAKALGATLVTHDRALLGLTNYLDVVDWATDF